MIVRAARVRIVYEPGVTPARRIALPVTAVGSFVGAVALALCSSVSLSLIGLGLLVLLVVIDSVMHRAPADRVDDSTRITVDLSRRR